MKIIARKDALAQGLKRYYTGKPCKHGHVDYRSTSNGCCLECARIKTAMYKEMNPDWARKYRQENKENLREYNREWGRANKEKVREYSRRSREKNRSERIKNCKDWHEKNRERQRQYMADRYREKRHEMIERSKKWREANPEALAAQSGRYRSKKINQSCACCTTKDFRAIYSQAKASGCEVDHVEPLALGGLHCRHNLQLLTPEEHKEKTRSDMARIADAKRSQAA